MPTHWRLDDDDDLDVSDGTWHLVSGRDAIVQDCRCALRAFLGEYFLARGSVGVDWYGEVLQGGASLAAIEALIAGVLRSREGVLNIDTLKLDTAAVSGDLDEDDRQDRKLVVDFTLNTIEGIVGAAEVIALPGTRDVI